MKLLANAAIRDIFVDQLATTRARHEFLLHAWVVMPEHVHMVARFHSDSTAPQVLRTLKTGVAKRVIARWREIEAGILGKITLPDGSCRFWQRGGGYDRNLRSVDDVREKIAYVHANPVRQGLVERPEEWEWSSARWWSGDRGGLVECDPVG